MSDQVPTGKVRMTIEVEVPIQDIVCHWTKDEAQALVDGDTGAREELMSQASQERRFWNSDVVHSSFSLDD